MTLAHLLDRHSARGQMVARLLVVLGALLGLFTMHGLSDHGASSHEMHTPVNPAAMATTHAGHAGDLAVSDPADAAVSAADPGEHSPGMAMAGLCLAVLVGAVTGLLLLHPHRAVAFIQATVFAPAATRPPSARRDRDPPCLFRLSVLRT